MHFELETAENGKVELTGYVMDADDIGTVERLAWEVEGVTEVSLSLEAPAWINEDWSLQAEEQQTEESPYVRPTMALAPN